MKPTKSQLNTQVQSIIDQYLVYTPANPEETDMIREMITEAYEYAYEKHAGQIRKSGELYISHTIHTAQEVLIIQPDITTIISCILHDVPEEAGVPISEIDKKFGPEVARIISGIMSLGKLKYRGRDETIDKMQKTFFAMVEDVRTIFVKFSDRIHNLRTLTHHEDANRADRIALESLHIYAPIASRLGVYEFKELLEDLSFKQLYPKEHLRITGQLADTSKQQDRFLTTSIQQIRSLLGEEYGHNINYRIKTPYSIFQKMQSRGLTNVRDVYDVFAVRVIVEDITDCYAVLGMIHGMWKPVPGRVKDYIASPKPNGYQSLHTTIVGLYDDYRQKPTEIQIRTNDMDMIAQYGQASHLSYKVGSSSLHEVNWMELLQDAVEDITNREYVDVTSAPTTIFVFTPKGDVRELPRGATPVDFAYSIHSDVGNRTSGARVNEKMVPLDCSLKNGDVVSVITQKNARPSPAWLDFVHTSKARSSINVEVRKGSGDHTKIVQKGKDIIKEYLFSKFGEKLDNKMSALDMIDGAKLDEKKKEELLYQVGSYTRRPNSVFRDKRKSQIGQKEEFEYIPKDIQLYNVIVGGHYGFVSRIAGCCKPKFPDQIRAVVRKQGEIMVHRKDCSAILQANPGRVHDAFWEIQKGGNSRRKLRFEFESDQPGILVKTVNIAYSLGVNVVSLEGGNISPEESYIELVIEGKNVSDLLSERFFDRVEFEIPAFVLGKILER